MWRPSGGAPQDAVVDLAGDLAGHRGLIVAGAGSGRREYVVQIAVALGWPVLAAPTAPVWGAPMTVPGFDALLRTQPDLVPELVVHLGGPLASRVANEWLAETGAVHIVAAGPRWVDPHGKAAVVLPWSAEAVVEQWSVDTIAVEPVDGGAWAERWQAAGAATLAAIDGVLEEAPTSEPAVARALARGLPAGGALGGVVVDADPRPRVVRPPGPRAARCTPTAAPTGSTAWCRRRWAWRWATTRVPPRSSSATSPSCTTATACSASPSAASTW